MLQDSGVLGDLRLKSENVGHTVSFISALGVDLASSVDKLDTGHPLVGAQLNLTSKVVEMANQRTQDNAVSLSGARAHGVNDELREIGVEAAEGLGGSGAAIGAVGSHDGGLSSLCLGRETGSYTMGN